MMSLFLVITKEMRKKLYKGKSLLFYSLSNNDAESRYLITDFYLIKVLKLM